MSVLNQLHAFGLIGNKDLVWHALCLRLSRSVLNRCTCVCVVINYLDVFSILYSPIWTSGVWKHNSKPAILKKKRLINITAAADSH